MTLKELARRSNEELLDCLKVLVCTETKYQNSIGYVPKTLARDEERLTLLILSRMNWKGKDDEN